MNKFISRAYKSGNSTVIVVPATIIKLLEIKPGNELIVDVTKK